MYSLQKDVLMSLKTLVHDNKALAKTSELDRIVVLIKIRNFRAWPYYGAN